MSDISSFRNSILSNELKPRLNTTDNQIKKSDLQGRGKIDANGDGQISSRELQNAAKKAGVDLSTLTTDDKLQIRTQISKLIKQGGSFSETNPMVYSFVITPSTDDVKSGALGEDGKPLTFTKGQSGDEIKKLNLLLRNLDFPAIGDKFQDSTEAMVKDFQLRNMFEKDATTGELKPRKGYEDVVLGVVDSKTLKVMEEATKMENPYERQNHNNSSPVIEPINPVNTLPQREVIIPTTINLPPINPTIGEVNPNTHTNQTNNVESPQRVYSSGEAGKFERVRDDIKNQIISSFIEKGLSPQEAEQKAEESLKLGGTVTEAAIRQDKLMGTDNKCYTAVKKGLEQSMDIPYKVYNNVRNGTHARTASDTLFKENKNLFQKIEIPRADVQYLPPGAIVVYHPANKAEAGHIGVQTIQLKTPEQQKSGAQGLPVTNVYEQDGKIVGLEVKVGKSTVKYDVKDGKVFDKNGKETNLTFDRADISDKQRNDPWPTARVDVFFPITKK
ncbi:MAG: hypothetical protein U0354_17395 [Candidatus Sericytochromatia bacterium]